MVLQILLGISLGIFFATFIIYVSNLLDEIFPEESPGQELSRIKDQSIADMQAASRRYRAYVERATRPYIKSQQRRKR